LAVLKTAIIDYEVKTIFTELGTISPVVSKAKIGDGRGRKKKIKKKKKKKREIVVELTTHAFA